jgi:hypothetical protein
MNLAVLLLWSGPGMMPAEVACCMQVCWAKDGDRVAACFSNKVVSVLDLRM